MIIGIVGGIGSGKSTVCKLIEFLGFDVYYFDEHANRITTGSPDIMEAIEKEFGTTERRLVGNMAFSNPVKMEFLNNLIHKRVLENFEEYYKEQFRKDPLVFFEAAYINKDFMIGQVDHLIFVEADVETRVKRIMSRNSYNVFEALKRIDFQTPILDKMKADCEIFKTSIDIHNIDNSSTINKTIDNTREVLKTIGILR